MGRKGCTKIPACLECRVPIRGFHACEPPEHPADIIRRQILADPTMGSKGGPRETWYFVCPVCQFTYANGDGCHHIECKFISTF